MCIIDIQTIVFISDLLVDIINALLNLMVT